MIGTLLGLPSGELNAIEAGHPTDVKWCCNKMLETWIDVDTYASWEKLDNALKSRAVSAVCSGPTVESHHQSGDYPICILYNQLFLNN